MFDSVIVTSRQLCFQMSARNDRRQPFYVSFTMPDNRLRLVYDDKFQEFGASFPSQTVYTCNKIVHISLAENMFGASMNSLATQ